MRTRAKQKFIAKATALDARVPQQERRKIYETGKL